MSLPARCLAALLATAALAVGPGVHAETWSHADARRDVVHIDTGVTPETSTPAPEDVRSDITRLTVRHTAARVVVTTRLRDLGRGPFTLQVPLQTPTGGGVLFLVQSRDGRHLDVASGAVEQPRCRGKRAEVDRAGDVIRIIAPRTCLDRPDWVRAGALFFDGDLLAVDEQQVIGYDDALQTGLEDESGPVPLTLGPKVRVG